MVELQIQIHGYMFNKSCEYLNNSYGNGLTHVAHGEAAERWELLERLHAQRLGGHQNHDGSVARLYRFRVNLSSFT